MSSFTIYLDEDNQSHALTHALTQAGIPVATSAQQSMNGQSDEAQLEHANLNGWVLYTSNGRDFDVLHRQYMASGRSHRGIIIRYGRQYSVGEQMRRVTAIWKTHSAEDMVNRVESLSQWGEERS